MKKGPPIRAKSSLVESSVRTLRFCSRSYGLRVTGYAFYRIESSADQARSTGSVARCLCSRSNRKRRPVRDYVHSTRSPASPQMKHFPKRANLWRRDERQLDPTCTFGTANELDLPATSSPEGSAWFWTVSRAVVPASPVFLSPERTRFHLRGARCCLLYGIPIVRNTGSESSADLDRAHLDRR